MVDGVARIFSPEYWFALGLLLEPEDEAGLVSAAGAGAGEARVARQRGAVSRHHRDGGPVTIWK